MVYAGRPAGREPGGSGISGQGIATLCAGAEADRPGIGALGTLHSPSPGGMGVSGEGEGGRAGQRGEAKVWKGGPAGRGRRCPRRVACFPRGAF